MRPLLGSPYFSLRFIGFPLFSLFSSFFWFGASAVASINPKAYSVFEVFIGGASQKRKTRQIMIKTIAFPSLLRLLMDLHKNYLRFARNFSNLIKNDINLIENEINLIENASNLIENERILIEIKAI